MPYDPYAPPEYNMRGDSANGKTGSLSSGAVSNQMLNSRPQQGGSGNVFAEMVSMGRPQGFSTTPTSGKRQLTPATQRLNSGLMTENRMDGPYASGPFTSGPYTGPPQQGPTPPMGSGMQKTPFNPGGGGYRPSVPQPGQGTLGGGAGGGTPWYPPGMYPEGFNGNVFTLPGTTAGASGADPSAMNPMLGSLMPPVGQIGGMQPTNGGPVPNWNGNNPQGGQRGMQFAGQGPMVNRNGVNPQGGHGMQFSPSGGTSTTYYDPATGGTTHNNPNPSIPMGNDGRLPGGSLPMGNDGRAPAYGSQNGQLTRPFYGDGSTSRNVGGIPISSGDRVPEGDSWNTNIRTGTQPSTGQPPSPGRRRPSSSPEGVAPPPPPAVGQPTDGTITTYVDPTTGGTTGRRPGTGAQPIGRGMPTAQTGRGAPTASEGGDSGMQPGPNRRWRPTRPGELDANGHRAPERQYGTPPPTAPPAAPPPATGTPGSTPGAPGSSAPGTPLDLGAIGAEDFSSFDAVRDDAMNAVTRQMMHAGSLTGAVNSGGFASEQARALSPIANQFAAQKTGLQFQAQQAQADRILDKYKFDNQEQLTRWVETNKNELQRYGIDANVLLGRYQADQGLAGQMAGASATASAAGAAAGASMYGADVQRQLGMANNALGWYGAQNDYNLGQGQIGLGFFNGQNQYNSNLYGHDINREQNIMNYLSQMYGTGIDWMRLLQGGDPTQLIPGMQGGNTVTIK